MAGQNDTCIKQKVALKPGKQLLKFDWAARKQNTHGAFYTSEFDVKVNGRMIKRIDPKDYSVKS